MKLIFIFSLPRSGSTLLQRILNNHEKILTGPETWQLLPMGAMTIKNQVVSEYSQDTFEKAHSDFINGLQGGTSTYYSCLNTFFTSLFSQYSTSSSEEFFLEKTPRNYLIIDFIQNVFPEAKFIFLFRNPLDIFNSILDTWGNGRLRHIHKHIIDFKSVARLYEGRLKLENNSISVRYEDLLERPESTIKLVCEYLSLNFSAEMLCNIDSLNLTGKRGDQKGAQLKQITFSKKKSVKISIVRKILFKKFIKSIPKNSSYDREIEEFINLQPSFSLKKNMQDIIDLTISKVILNFKLNLLFRNKYRGKYYE